MSGMPTGSTTIATTLGSLTGLTGWMSPYGGSAINTVTGTTTTTTYHTSGMSQQQYQMLQRQYQMLQAQGARQLQAWQQLPLASSPQPNPQLQPQTWHYPGNPAGRNPALRPNRYLDASDLLEDFIAYVAPHGVTKAQFRKLPLELFIQWLVLESARADGEDIAELPDPVRLLADQRAMVAADLEIAA